MSDKKPNSHAFVGLSTFGKLPLCENLDELDADVAILGIPYENTMGYGGARLGPKGIREGSRGNRMELSRGCYSPDDDSFYFGPQWKIVDCGDVPIVGCDVEPSFTYVRDAVRKVIKKGALLVSLGGDHAITTPILEALDDQGPFCVIHIDAHMDWSNAPGRPYCHSKPMRRASEMPHITGMAQLGIRAFTQTTYEAYQDALDWGSKVISTKQIREMGIDKVLDTIPKCDRYYVSIDIDAMDPSIASATGSTAQGGLLYDETREILKGIAKLGDVFAFDMVEVAPTMDLPGEPTCRLASRLICDLLGFILKEKENRKGAAKD